MHIGVLLPHRELGRDGARMRAFATALEELGYGHVLAYEHVLGAGTARRPDWSGPYTEADPFHEPLVLFSHLSAVTERLGFITGVMVGPQRQTALLAKQAAELDIVSGGRFRLGVGIGWNAVEYEALGVPWERRGDRFEEQINVMRQLWSEPVVDISGEFHRIDDAGINPLPERLVPVWIGTGLAPRALDRVARLADGWIPSFRTAPTAEPALDALRAACAAHGRDPSTIGIEARVVLADMPRDEWAATIEGWRAAGATHVALATARLGLTTLDDHLRLLTELSAEHIAQPPRTPAQRGAS